MDLPQSKTNSSSVRVGLLALCATFLIFILTRLVQSGAAPPTVEQMFGVATNIAFRATATVSESISTNGGATSSTAEVDSMAPAPSSSAVQSETKFTAVASPNAPNQDDIPCELRVYADQYGQSMDVFHPWLSYIDEFLHVNIKAIELVRLTDSEVEDLIQYWTTSDVDKGIENSACRIDLISRDTGISYRMEQYLASGKVAPDYLLKVHRVIAAARDARHSLLKTKGDSAMVDSPYPKQWHRSMYTNGPKNSGSVVALDRRRPFLVGSAGEVFNQVRSGSETDLYLNRMLNPIPYATTVHFIQGPALGLRGEKFQNRHYMQDWDLNSLVVTRPTRSRRRKIEQDAFRAGIKKSKVGFAAIMNRSVMKRTHYTLDSVTRYVFCDMLNSYKPCHGISLPNEMYRNLTLLHVNCVSGNYYSKAFPDMFAWWCFQPYKFALSMENSQFPGYISEKIFNAKRAYAIPVYFGAPDAAKYLNPKAFIHCKLSDNVLFPLRKKVDDSKRYAHLMPEEQRADKTLRASDESLVKWVRGMIEEDLKPCMEEVMRIDNDDKAYWKMLEEPLFLNNTLKRTYLDGYEQARDIADLLHLASRGKVRKLSEQERYLKQLGDRPYPHETNSRRQNV